MRYVSLKNTSLTYFNTKGCISELAGSSKYRVWDSRIELKEVQKKNKIESTSAITGFLQSIKDTETQHLVIRRMKENYEILFDICISASFNEIDERLQLDLLNEALSRITVTGERVFIDMKLHDSLSQDKKTNYYKDPRQKNDTRRINKTKVKGKMYALFNLKCSRRFVAFYSVSFPIGTTDDQAFICWNNWLTQLRKRFELTNYIWVTEKQKNGTIHFHMLTNNYMPILQVNRVMAIIIDNQVKAGLMSWGLPLKYTRGLESDGVMTEFDTMSNPCMNNYNGVDVDSIFNSKRHKKTGKNLNQTEIRNWVSKYVTKYVTKNNEKFEHLCWHCSRSVSILFTSTIVEISNAWQITNHLPSIRNMYIHYKSDFNDVWVFCFVPAEHLFERVKLYNDLIFGEYIPTKSRITNIVTYKTKCL